MKKHLFIFMVFILSINKIKAQDPYFVQQLNSRTYLNPAMVGVDSTLVTSLATRFQWVGIKGPGTAYNTQMFTANQYVSLLKGGIGFDIMRNASVRSEYITNNYNFNYAPHFELFDHKLALQLGLSAGYFEKSANWHKIDKSLIIQYSKNDIGYFYPPPEPLSHISGWDFSTGVFAYTKNIYGGIGVFHLNRPDQGLIGTSKLPYKLIINAGANLNFKEDVKNNLILSPNIVLIKQGAFNELSFGINAKYKYFVTGLMYKKGDAIAINIGFQNHLLKISYSCDKSFSKLTSINYYSHEIHLVGFIHYQKKQCNIKTIRFI